MRVVMENELTMGTFGEQSRLYAQAVVQRLTEALRNRDMDESRASLIVFLIDEALQLCMRWLNHYIARYGVYSRMFRGSHGLIGADDLGRIWGCLEFPILRCTPFSR